MLDAYYELPIFINRAREGGIKIAASFEPASYSTAVGGHRLCSRTPARMNPGLPGPRGKRHTMPPSSASAECPLCTAMHAFMMVFRCSRWTLNSEKFHASTPR
jgi:hypothetical protein